MSVKRMNILVVSDVSAEQVHGGAERMLVHHIRALRDSGYGVTVLTRQPDPDAALTMKLDGRVVEHRLLYTGDRGTAGLQQLKKGAAVWWHKYAGRFDAVVAEQPFIMWALLKAGCNLPRLQVCHSFAFEEYATRYGKKGGFKHRLAGFAMRRLERKVYRSADRFLVLSHFMQKRLSDFFQIDKNLITIASGGVDVPEIAVFERRDELRHALQWDGPVVITLRNLVERTGVDLLVKAAAILKEEMPELRWCVIGRGELLQPLQELASQLEVADRVEFTGYLAEEAVQQRLIAADLFMLPTRDLEGFGLVTLEANACGLPVVATPVTANKEVVPSLPFNRLADAVSAEALANTVRVLFKEAQSDDLSRYLRRHELRHAVEKKYAWQHHDVDFLQVVESLRH